MIVDMRVGTISLLVGTIDFIVGVTVFIYSCSRVGMLWGYGPKSSETDHRMVPDGGQMVLPEGAQTAPTRPVAHTSCFKLSLK